MHRSLLLVAASAALATAASPPDPDFAPIGGSYGQTARIHISAFPPDPCVVAAGFRTGEVTPPEPDRTFSLAAGQTAFYDLNLNRLAGRFGIRIELRPRVVIQSGRCSASVEVFETFTGRTTAAMRLFLGASPPDPNINAQPPPDPDFAPLGAVPGQIVRLGVGRGEGINATPPDPCRGVLAFLDMQSNIIGPTRAVDLAPGQMAFLDFNPSSVNAIAALSAARITVRPHLFVPPPSTIADTLGGNIHGCQASAQVFETSTGWSVSGIPGSPGLVAPPDPDFAPLGGSFGQIMRIMVSAYPPDPCSVAVGFRAGETSPPDPDRTFNLAAGQSAFADLDLSKLAGRFGVRVEVTARVVILSGRCSASAEMFEVFSGRTTAHMNLFLGAASPPDPNFNTNPPPEPEFAALGAVSGQLVRLGVVRGEGFNTYPPPCRGTLGFVNMLGQSVGPSLAFDLTPGQRAFVTLDPAKLTTAFVAASRQTVRPVLTSPPDPESVGGCQASVQLYESSTGWSTEAVSGR